MKTLELTFKASNRLGQKTVTYNLPDKYDTDRVYIDYRGNEASVYIRKGDKPDPKHDLVLFVRGFVADPDAPINEEHLDELASAIRMASVQVAIADAIDYINHCDVEGLPLLMSLPDMLFMGKNARAALKATKMLEVVLEDLKACDIVYEKRHFRFKEMFEQNPRKFLDFAPLLVQIQHSF